MTWIKILVFLLFITVIMFLLLLRGIKVFLIIDASTGKIAYICFNDTGNCYAALDPYYLWSSALTLPEAAGKAVTTGHVNGITYVYIATLGCYKFDFSTNTLVSVTLTSLNASLIMGIMAVQGYLVAWTSNTI